jgi:hypothetical protein
VSPTPVAEVFKVCKNYPAGVVGPDVTVDFTVDDYNDGSIDASGTATVPAGECITLALGGSVSHDHSVTVTEHVPAGFISSFVAQEYHAGVITTYPSVSGNVATGYMHGDRGFTVTYLNDPLPGLNGCTHGYWKVDQHFDSYPAGYTSSTLFSSVFENAFPGMTLVDVMWLHGGGLNALGRETVAALLNAASGFYWYSPTEVINKFNAVFPGTKDDYTALKDDFESHNIAGCPLN